MITVIVDIFASAKIEVTPTFSLDLQGKTRKVVAFLLCSLENVKKFWWNLCEKWLLLKFVKGGEICETKINN